MKKTFQEKLKSRVNGWNRKHPEFKRLYLAYEVCMLLFYHLGMHFVQNGKRYLCVCVCVLFFLTNSSFAYYGSDVRQEALVADSDITLADEQTIIPEEVVLLEDEDVADEYGQENFEYLQSEEQYTLDDILKGHDGYLEASSQEEEVQTADAEALEFSKDDWRLVLINKQHPIPEGYTFELETITNGMQCDKRIIEALVLMLTEAREQGINLAIRSPYRDLSRQEYLFNRKVNRYMDNGMSYMDAYKTASQSVTVPGASEHQIGLSLDITSDSYVTLDKKFEDTAEGKWLAEHSCEYGFILRYPEGKEYITSIQYEPWHFRYVGVEAATIIMENELTLEEFWDEYVY